MRFEDAQISGGGQTNIVFIWSPTVSPAAISTGHSQQSNNAR